MCVFVSVCASVCTCACVFLFFYPIYIHIYIYLFYLFIYFWLRRVLVAACGVFIEAHGIFRCSESSLLWCAGFSLVAVHELLSSCDVLAPGRMRSVVCGTWALLLRRAGLIALWHVGILVPRPGIEPKSPALEGRFLTTGPPGKSLSNIY